MVVPALLASETQGQGLGLTPEPGLVNDGQGLGPASGQGLESSSQPTRSFRAAAVAALSAVHEALALASSVEVTQTTPPPPLVHCHVIHALPNPHFTLTLSSP